MDAMNGSRPSERPADRERGFDEIADDLYALRPDAFAAARDDEVRKARDEGRQPLARELSRLRRPTQSAWLVNLLWRDQRATMEQFFELADDLRRAHAQAVVPELHRLTAQRRELEAALIRRARTLAQQGGVNVTATMEREGLDTLAAALASPDVANEVRTGRLVKPASYAGFGTIASSPPTMGAQPREAGEEESRPPVSPRRSTKDRPEAGASQREDQRREEAERRVQEARAALEAAAGELTGLARAAEAAHQHHQEVREQVDRLQQLRDLRENATAAERAALAAARRQDQAEKTHEAALRTLARAEQYLKESRAVD